MTAERSDVSVACDAKLAGSRKAISRARPSPMTSSLPLLTLDGIFYRAVDPAFRDKALCGSRRPGRYSASGQPTLYLSSSPEGVDAAMIAHRGNRSQALELLRLRVTANRIFDLRDPEARRLAKVSLDQATAPLAGRRFTRPHSRIVGGPKPPGKPWCARTCRSIAQGARSLASRAFLMEPRRFRQRHHSGMKAVS